MSFDPVSKIWRNPEPEPNPILNPKCNLGQAILHSLARTPSQIAQISADTGVEVTCKQLKVRSIRVAENLRARGYGQGNIFAIAAKNSEHVAPVMIASFLLEAPINTLDPAFSAADLAHMLGQTRPILVFCDHDNCEIVRSALKEVNLIADVVTVDRRVEGVGFVEELFEPAGNDVKFQSPIIGEESPVVVIICSSGTTGSSKGVCLSHENFLIFNHWRMVDEETNLAFSSLYWYTGFTHLVSPLLNGTKRLITAQKSSPELFLDLVEKYRVTSFVSAPSFAAQVVKNPRFETANLSTLRVWLITGSPLSLPIRRQIEARLSHGKVLVPYGATEIARLVSINFPRDKEGSVGTLTSGVELKIVDDDGNALNAKQKGEILIRAKPVFLGYYGLEEQTKEVLDVDGWIHSGDIGYMDEERFLFIVDRKKTLLKYEGYQIAPTELEAIIEGLDGVLLTCVVGIPSVDHGDLPAALIVREKERPISEKDVHEALAGKALSSFKKLWGGVYFVDEIPLTPSGKIKRIQAKEIAIKLYEQAKGQLTQL